MLITGGGAFNLFLLERMKKNAPGNIEFILPDKNTILFKEALIFAFLGLLRIRGEFNVLKTVTGAAENNIGGALYG